MSSISPDMLLVIPDPGITPGQLWAEQLNESLSLIDSHDHTTNHGVKVPSGGLNINADLPFNTHSATGLLSSIYQSQTVSPVTSTSVYVKSGELAYRDSLGQEVVLTNNGSIAGAAGNISGLVSPASAAFSSLTDSFTFNYDTNLPGKLNISDISLYGFGLVSAIPVTIKSPVSLAAPYNFILPGGLPSAGRQSLVITTAGEIGYANNVNGIGMVPVGAVVAMMSNLTGSYDCTATTVADPESGYVRCVGQTLTDPLSAMNGQVVPDLTTAIYMRGTVTSGGTGSSNSRNLAHSHLFSHVHEFVSTDSSTNMYSLSVADPSVTTIGHNASSPNFPFSASFSGNIPGGPTIYSANSGTSIDYFTTGVLNAAGGTSGTNAVTAVSLAGSTDIQPSYIDVQYLMRVY